MGELVLKIDGVDLLPYIQKKGIVWKRNDIDSADAGEMADGTYRRDRIITRRSLEITIMDELDTAAMTKIMKSIYPQWVNVQFLDPLEGTVITRCFYSNNVPVTVAVEREGKVTWEGFTFTLYERGVPG